MDSSISPSKPISTASRVWPLEALLSIGGSVIVLVICAWYSLHWNPEVRFFAQAARIKTRYADGLNKGPKVILAGDSNCAFSLNPDVLLKEFQIPSVNAGLAAGMGPVVLSEFALSLARPGDTLVISFAPALLTQAGDHTSLGVQFSYARGHSLWVTGSDLELAPLSRLSSVLQLRPGAQHVFALLGKALVGRALYRYSDKDVDENGWMHTDFKMPITGPPGRGPHLSGDGLLLLRKLRGYCESKHIRVVYCLPWGYVPPEQMRRFQQENRDILREIAAVIPALRDNQLGAWSDVNGFSDTLWHLAPPVAILRTRALGRSLATWDVWGPGEL